jgi:hypothetical protein
MFNLAYDGTSDSDLTHRVKAGPFKWGLWCKANVSRSRVTSCGGVISAAHTSMFVSCTRA